MYHKSSWILCKEGPFKPSAIIVESRTHMNQQITKQQSNLVSWKPGELRLPQSSRRKRQGKGEIKKVCGFLPTDLLWFFFQISPPHKTRILSQFAKWLETHTETGFRHLHPPPPLHITLVPVHLLRNVGIVNTSRILTLHIYLQALNKPLSTLMSPTNLVRLWSSPLKLGRAQWEISKPGMSLLDLQETRGSLTRLWPSHLKL